MKKITLGILFVSALSTQCATGPVTVGEAAGAFLKTLATTEPETDYLKKSADSPDGFASYLYNWQPDGRKPVEAAAAKTLYQNLKGAIEAVRDLKKKLKQSNDSLKQIKACFVNIND